jgi:hypothetical protein
MAQGLLGGVLPAIYSGADQLKRGVYGLLTNPRQSIENTASGLIGSHLENVDLWKQAHGNPNNPLEVTNQNALNMLTDRYMNNVVGFAPAGMTKLPTSYQDLQGLQNELYTKIRSYSKPSEIPQQLKEEYFNVKKSLDINPNNPKNIVQEPVSLLDDSYKGQHQAPMRDSGKPLFDLKDIYPDDFYSSKGVQYYGTGSPRDVFAIGKLQSLKDKPDADVVIYRAVPKDAQFKINQGDWVTIDREYAKQHGESALNGEYKIIRRTVKAKDVYTNGDSPFEMGFDPSK